MFVPFRFESLRIWHDAVDFSDEVYRLSASFPDNERYGLTSQITRAANSISLNIAEGSGRDTPQDFNRFLGIAIGSTFEVAAALFLALKRGYVSDEIHQRIYAQAESLGKSISRFRKTLIR